MKINLRLDKVDICDSLLRKVPSRFYTWKKFSSSQVWPETKPFQILFFLLDYILIYCTYVYFLYKNSHVKPTLKTCLTEYLSCAYKIKKKTIIEELIKSNTFSHKMDEDNRLHKSLSCTKKSQKVSDKTEIITYQQNQMVTINYKSLHSII